MNVPAPGHIRLAITAITAERRSMRNSRGRAVGAETVVIVAAFVGVAALVLYLVLTAI